MGTSSRRLVSPVTAAAEDLVSPKRARGWNHTNWGFDVSVDAGRGSRLIERGSRPRELSIFETVGDHAVLPSPNESTRSNADATGP
jgi:hypothetical protein